MGRSSNSRSSCTLTNMQAHLHWQQQRHQQGQSCQSCPCHIAAAAAAAVAVAAVVALAAATSLGIVTGADYGSVRAAAAAVTAVDTAWRQQHMQHPCLRLSLVTLQCLVYSGSGSTAMLLLLLLLLLHSCLHHSCCCCCCFCKQSFTRTTRVRPSRR
jgi:hypothetical protein